VTQQLVLLKRCDEASRAVLFSANTETRVVMLPRDRRLFFSLHSSWMGNALNNMIVEEVILVETTMERCCSHSLELQGIAKALTSPGPIPCRRNDQNL